MQGNQMTTTTTTILDYILLLSLSSYLLKTILGNLSSLKEGFTSLWALKIIGCLFLTIVARPIWNILFSSHTPRDSKLPQIRTFLPLGIDYIRRGIIYSAQNKSLVFWEELFRKYHPFQTLEVRLGPQTVIVSRDPQVVKALLTTQFGDFGKGERFHTEWREFLGDAIFTTDGDKWHASRALIRPMFTPDRVSNLSTFERHVQKLLRILESPRHERQPVNVLDLCLRLTMDIATDFLLGQSVDSLSNPTHRFSAAFADVQRIQSWITMAG